MTKITRWPLLLVLVVVLLPAGGCKKKRTVPASLPKAPMPSTPKTEKPPPPQPAPPPKPEKKPEETEPVRTMPVQNQIPAPNEPKPEKKAPAPASPAYVPQGPVTPPPLEPKASGQPEPLQLGQILTPEQRQSYNREIDDMLDRARVVLNEISSKKLTAAQRSTRRRVETFIQQAEEARSIDLVRAKNLSERADLLAKELRRSMS